MPEKCLTCLTDQWVCLRKAGHWNTLLSNLWNRYSVPASFSICSRITGWSLIKVAELRHLFIYACGRWKIKMKACNKLACDSNFWGWKLAETEIKKCLHSKKKKRRALIRCHSYLATCCHSWYLRLFAPWMDIWDGSQLRGSPLSVDAGLWASFWMLTILCSLGALETFGLVFLAEDWSTNLIGSEENLSSFFVLCNEGAPNLGCGGRFCLRQA